MMFGFARDRGLPPLFRRVDSSGTPVYTIWLAAFLAFCLALPSLGSSVAFAAATSIATIGLYLSYSVPILIGLIWGSRFEELEGPFNLGRMGSKAVAVVACAWTVRSERNIERHVRTLLIRLKVFHNRDFLPPRIEPSRFTDVELHACGSRHYLRCGARILGLVGAEVVYRAGRAYDRGGGRVGRRGEGASAGGGGRDGGESGGETVIREPQPDSSA